MNPNDLIEGLKALSHRLTECQIPHAFGGAIAYGFYGNPRVTNDYEINIFLPESHAREVLGCLAAIGVEANERSVSDIEKKGQTRLVWSGVMVDLFFAYAPFHEAAAARVEKVSFAGGELRILAAEDLVVFKALFNRAHDWEDIERMMVERSAAIDLPYVYHWLSEILGPDDSRIERLRETATAAAELMAE